MKRSISRKQGEKGKAENASAGKCRWSSRILTRASIREKPRRGRIAFWEGGFGTVGYWPRWTTEGVAYMDAMEGFAGILPVSPKVTVEKGMVVKFEGAPEQGVYFKSMIEKFGPDVAHIGEIMIG
jgi:hypothetical protein